MSGHNKRKNKRKNSVLYHEVVSVKTKAIIGRVINISEGGLMVHCSSLPEMGAVLSLQVDLEEPPDYQAHTIVFTGKVVRVCDSSSPDGYDVGFELSDVTEADARLLKFNVDNLGY